MPARIAPRQRTVAHVRPAHGAERETVHWGVIALTLFTAIGVLIGAAGPRGREPRELLPIVMIAR